MSKKLTIIRHAKSDWGNSNLKDFDRPLNKRGFRDAPFMANTLFNRQIKVDKLISSPALRACTTAKIFADKFGINHSEIELKEELYHANFSVLLEQVHNIQPAHNHSVFFGHNPGLSNLVSLLVSDYLSMPTCAIAELEIHVNEWNLVAPGTASLINFDYPKNHQPLK